MVTGYHNMNTATLLERRNRNLHYRLRRLSWPSKWSSHYDSPAEANRAQWYQPVRAHMTNWQIIAQILHFFTFTHDEVPCLIPLCASAMFHQTFNVDPSSDFWRRYERSIWLHSMFDDNKFQWFKVENLKAPFNILVFSTMTSKIRSQCKCHNNPFKR